MFHNLIARLRATPPWVWITVAIAAAGLIISFLIYRQGNPTSNGTQGTGSNGPVNPGDITGGYSPYGNNSSQYQPDYNTQSYLQQIVNLLNRPATVGPVGPAGPQGAPGPVGPQGPAASPAPAMQPHPVPAATTPAQLAPVPVIGAVAHADTYQATQSHPGSVAISSPHPVAAGTPVIQTYNGGHYVNMTRNRTPQPAAAPPPPPPPPAPPVYNQFRNRAR